MDDVGRRGGLVGPLILISLGVLFLLANLGALDWSVWEILFRLWPVLLIAWGLDIIVGRRSPWLSLGIVLVVVALAGAALWYYSPEGVAGQELTSEAINQQLQGATRADVEISSGVGELRLGAAESSDVLIEGTVRGPERQRVVSDFNVAGDTATYRLRTRDEAGFPFSFGQGDRSWDLDLNAQVPLDLTVNTGVGTSNLDLRQLSLTDLSVSTGVGQTTITLPAQGDFGAQINGGVGEVNILVPSSLAATIRVDGGLGDVSVIGDYVEQDRTYTSAGFSSAQERVNLRVSGGVGRIAVRQVD